MGVRFRCRESGIEYARLQKFENVFSPKGGKEFSPSRLPTQFFQLNMQFTTEKTPTPEPRNGKIPSRYHDNQLYHNRITEKKYTHATYKLTVLSNQRVQ